MNITKGKKEVAQKVVIYGPEGIGKTTLAGQFPDPVFIDTEGGTENFDLARMDKPTSFTMLLEQIKYIKNNPSSCKTLVIDTADWAEKLCIEEFCSKKQLTGVEDMGYGKGYVYVAEDFGKMLNLLEEVKLKGINIVITAHAQMRKFEQPDELGSYDRWELKLQKKTAPLLMEWADIVLFANYETYVVNVDGQGTQKGKNKPQGGKKRIMYTEHHPCWDAKNRHGLQDKVLMDYSSIAHCIPNFGPTNTKQVEAPGSTTPATQEQPKEVPTETTTKPDGRSATVPEPEETPKEEPKKEEGLPKKLVDLVAMAPFTIKYVDIQAAVESRGYYPKGTPIENYDPVFIDGVLIGAWDKVCDMIKEIKLSKGEFLDINEGEAPFN